MNYHTMLPTHMRQMIMTIAIMANVYILLNLYFLSTISLVYEIGIIIILSYR